jgi:hypothetical protein
LILHSVCRLTKKANKQQILQGLTCALDKPLEAATTENAPYKTDNEERVSDHCEERGGSKNCTLEMLGHI